MKTLAKLRACNHSLCNRRKKRLKIYLWDPVSYREFRETGHRTVPWGTPA